MSGMWAEQLPLLRTDNTRFVAMQVTMVDPVIAADGHTYARHAVEHWLQQHDTSPVTGKALSHKRLLPNQIVKRVIVNDTRFR